MSVDDVTVFHCDSVLQAVRGLQGSWMNRDRDWPHAQSWDVTEVDGSWALLHYLAWPEASLDVYSYWSVPYLPVGVVLDPRTISQSGNLGTLIYRTYNTGGGGTLTPFAEVESAWADTYVEMTCALFEAMTGCASNVAVQGSKAYGVKAYRSFAYIQLSTDLDSIMMVNEMLASNANSSAVDNSYLRNDFILGETQQGPQGVQLAGSADNSKIVEALQDISQMRTEISVNNGAAMYSVSGGTRSEE